MKPIKILTPLLMAFVLSVAAAPAVQAQGFENRTIFTFDAPVQVPGAVLPAGQYVFQLVNPEQPTRAVEIRKVDGGQALVTTVTQETKRLEAEDADGVTVTFVATKGNYPPAIKSWFYPGEITGHVFVYPEEQAKRIAEETKQLVLSRGEGNDFFLMSESGDRQPYGGDAQRAYLSEEEGQAPRVRAAGSGDANQRIKEQLDRIEQLVQRGLAPQPEQGTVGTMGANKDQVMVAREDLRAIQQYVEHLRRDLASSREK